jgi:hypothetical protein
LTELAAPITLEIAASGDGLICISPLRNVQASLPTTRTIAGDFC